MIVFGYLTITLKEGKEVEDFLEALDSLLNEWGIDDKSLTYKWDEEG